jgi:lactoylglutathione lyase
MRIDHIAIWTTNLELLKNYYVMYFNGNAGEKYINGETHFESYFINFESGSRIELMKKPGIPENLYDRSGSQHLGLIHLAFEEENMEMVNKKAMELADNGFKIIRGPRETGDGYYEFETFDPDNNRIEVATRFVD